MSTILNYNERISIVNTDLTQIDSDNFINSKKGILFGRFEQPNRSLSEQRK